MSSVAEFYYLEGGLLFGFSVAAGLTLVSIHRPNYILARRCAWAAFILFGSIAVVWGITTFESGWIRIPAVGIAGLVAAVCLTEALRFIKNREFPDIAPATEVPALPTTGAPTPAFDLSDHAKADIKDTKIIGNPSGVVKATGQSSFTMTDSLIVGASANTGFPPPTGEYAAISNDMLRQRAAELARELQSFQQKVDAKSTVLMTLRGDKWNQKAHSLSIENDSEFRERFRASALSLLSEILHRVGRVEIPRDFHGSRMRMAVSVLLNDKFAGPQPASAIAELLEFIAQKL